MPKTREQKEQALEEIKQGLKNAKSVVFTDYSGLEVNMLNELRGKLYEAGATMRVVKNSLLKLIDKDIDLKGQTAVVYSEEKEVEPIKVIYDFKKENEKPEVKMGMLNGNLINASKVEQLSTLPSLDELRAKLVGQMMAPVSGFVGVNREVYSSFARVLNGYKNSK